MGVMQHRERIYVTPSAAIQTILAAENEALRRKLAQLEFELAAARALIPRATDSADA